MCVALFPTALTPAQSCPICGERARPFLALRGLPSLSVALWPTAREARECPRGDLTLLHCGSCDFIFNSDFDSRLTEYDAAYENALHFSDVYRHYAEEEAVDLIERYDVHGKSIVDIGCGDGQFLSRLCAVGGNRGKGFDPSFPDRQEPRLHPDVKIEKRYFRPAEKIDAPDLIVCRQTLEHIPEPLNFLQSLHRSLPHRSDIVLSFEVPNAEHLVGDLSVWDLTYEHCNYFTATGLRSVFERSGFCIRALRAGFGGLNLTIESSPSPETGVEFGARESGRLARNFDHFAEHVSARISHCNECLREWNAQSLRVALWGAGARASAFLNMVEAADAIGMVGDINPRKHGFFLPGSAQEIGPPTALSEFAPDIVLLMNGNYRDEVAENLKQLGVAAELRVI